MKIHILKYNKIKPLKIKLLTYYKQKIKNVINTTVNKNKLY